MGCIEHIAVNGWECAALVVPLAGGLRVQFSEEDFDTIGVWRGDFVPVRRPGLADVWVTVASVTRLPPVVWVVFAERSNASVRTVHPRRDPG
jgi:hypothetical protein